MKLLAAFLALLAAAIPATAAEPVRLSADDALQQDAASYATAFGLTGDEALLRLRQQRASIAVTERLRVRFADRLASIRIVHRPSWGVVVTLAGTDVPPDTVEQSDGLPIPVGFIGGAGSTRAAALRLLDAERGRLPGLVPGYRGAGVDPASGGLVVMQRLSVDPRPQAEVERDLTATLGLPVRVRRLDAVMSDSAAIGGGRVVGPNSEGRLFRCTTGFVVKNASGQLGITTAAHCPDTLNWRGPDGEERLLPMLGSWGAAQNDIQINGGVGLAEPLLFSDTGKTSVRPVTSWATRPMTRVGDWLCLRGESSGYACSEVELTDFAPAGQLCGGLCTNSWVTLRGPRCKSGDSGAPIFLGSVAYGTLKGGAYLPDGGCAFSYYQSVDYLPEGWRVLTVR
ncbi:hypothetical protein GCM10022281_04090 [Sphingomonas rosea]|uniref:Uncharacterized protein n=1 Tax=Sphingomonas rosea TaxID=335605 RepID=A0ABP7TMA2_9SPHN